MSVQQQIVIISSVHTGTYTLANCFSLLLGLCEVVTTTFGSSTPAQAYSSSIWLVVPKRREGEDGGRK